MTGWKRKQDGNTFIMSDKCSPINLYTTVFGSAVRVASRPWQSHPFVLGVCSTEELL